MKLVDQFNLNSLNPFNNPELRFSKKFTDSCEKANIAYTDHKIKSFIASRVKYQLRADYPEDLKELESSNLQAADQQRLKTEAVLNRKNSNNSNNCKNNNINNNDLNLNCSEDKQMQKNNNLNSNYPIANSSVMNPLLNSSTHFDNLKTFGDLAAVAFNTGDKSEYSNILSEITNNQIETSKPAFRQQPIDIINISANCKKLSNNSDKNQTIDMQLQHEKIGEEDKKPDGIGKQFNFINPFINVHKDLTNNLNNNHSCNNNNSKISSNNSFVSGIDMIEIHICLSIYTHIIL